MITHYEKVSLAGVSHCASSKNEKISVFSFTVNAYNNLYTRGCPTKSRLLSPSISKVPHDDDENMINEYAALFIDVLAGILQ